MLLHLITATQYPKYPPYSLNTRFLIFFYLYYEEKHLWKVTVLYFLLLDELQTTPPPLYHVYHALALEEKSSTLFKC